MPARPFTSGERALLVDNKARRYLVASSGFGMCTTEEVLVRSWKVDGAAVRPDHRMIAHTGLLTAGRLLRPPA